MTNVLSEMLPVKLATINQQPFQTVNARTLHFNLKISRKFSNWIREQIERADLELNVDYIVISDGDIHVTNIDDKEVNGGRSNIEYILTLDSAKHIVMLSRSSEGKKIRKYFIEIEKEWRNQLFQSIPIAISETETLPEKLYLEVKDVIPLYKATEELLGDRDTIKKILNAIGQRLETDQQRHEQTQQSITEITDRLEKVEHVQESAKEAIEEVSEPAVVAPVETVQMRIVKAVDLIVTLTGLSHESTWNMFYAELRRRCHFDASARKRFTKSKKSKIQITIESGYGEQFYAIIYEKLQLIQKSIAS